MSSEPYAYLNYVSLTRSIATPASTWYAGANSVDGGSNTGWTFTGPPPQANANLILASLQVAAPVSIAPFATAALILPSLLGSSAGAVLVEGGSNLILSPLKIRALVTISFIGIPHSLLESIIGAGEVWWQAGPMMVKEEG